MQPKTIIHIFIKLNQQAKIFFLKIPTRGDAESSKNSNFQGYTQQYALEKQATNVLHRYQRQDKQNQNSWNQIQGSIQP